MLKSVLYFWATLWIGEKPLDNIPIHASVDHKRPRPANNTMYSSSILGVLIFVVKPKVDKDQSF